jgi:hypothetical protein
MINHAIGLNYDVTKFLDELNHPLRKEIERLRLEILSADTGLQENIKWNGPNYFFDKSDRITMKIQPPKLIHLIFHCGAKVQKQPENRLIKDDSGVLSWKENDRAVATFRNMAEIEQKKSDLARIIQDWIKATS